MAYEIRYLFACKSQIEHTSKFIVVTWNGWKKRFAIRNCRENCSQFFAIFSIFFCFLFIFRKVFAVLLFCYLLFFFYSGHIFTNQIFTDLHQKPSVDDISGMSFCFLSSLFYDLVTNRISFCCHCLISLAVFYHSHLFLHTHTSKYPGNISVFEKLFGKIVCATYFIVGVAWRGFHCQLARIGRINESFLLEMAWNWGA